MSKLKEQLMDVGSATASGGGAGRVGIDGSPSTAKRTLAQSGEDWPTVTDDEYITNKVLPKEPSNSAAEWLEVLEQNIPSLKKALKPQGSAEPKSEKEVKPKKKASSSKTPSEEPDVEIPTLPGEKEATPNVGPEVNQPDAEAAEDMGIGGDEGNVPTAPMDPMAGGMGDVGMGTGTDSTQQLSSTEIGRVFELKKIYARLTTLETFLQEETDDKMVEIRASITKAIDLFETVITNIQLYRDKLDDIIIAFYKFLDETFDQVRTYYKNNTGKNSKE